ncbi:MAG TPA: type I secretion system permease/ATPase, partial [Rhodospirillales bacterium]|nr:type I secretion system permease/ATPase [Rhodospirillales bacterium]
MPSDPLSNVVRQCRSALLVVGAFSLFINVLVLTSPIYMMQMYDRVLSSGRVETLVFLTLIAGLAILVMGALEVVRGRLLARIGGWMETSLSPELIGSSLRSALVGAQATAQPLRDLGTVRAFLGGTGVNAIFDAPWAPIFLAIIYWLHPVLGLIGIGAAVVLLAIAVLNELWSRRLLREAGRLTLANTQRADAAIRNAGVFHAMGMLDGFLFGWMGRTERAQSGQLQASDRSAVIIGASKFFRVFVQILILGAGAYLVLRDELTSGGMIAASILLGRALAPVDQAIGAWKSMVAARDAFDRIKRLLDQFPPRPAAMPLPAPRGQLACEGVTYVVHGRDRPILNQVTFTLAAGDVLGVIGPSAAGKSTLCKVLVGMWVPTHGHARLDGADLSAWPPSQLGQFIGYLPQDVELFSGTIRDNIARLIPDPDPAAVVEAARIAGVHDMILRLPKGYESEIGEGGSFLSGGQRQRIGLARALFGRPQLIVLDEPNASLDAEGEESLIAAIRTAQGWGATVVLVAHAPRVLQPANKLLFLRDGRSELFGERDAVLAKLRAVPVARPA